MAPRTWLPALIMATAASPLSAATEDPTPAPPGTADTRYCMRIEALTGSRLELIKCWTRDEWAAQDVDVDRDWARDGVRTIG